MNHNKDYEESCRQIVTRLTFVGAQVFLYTPPDMRKGKNDPKDLSVDLRVFFEPLPADLGLLLDYTAGRMYAGDVQISVFTLRQGILKTVLKQTAAKDQQRAISLLQTMWPTYQETEAAAREATGSAGSKAWSQAVHSIAGKCMRGTCYAAFEVNLTGMDKKLVSGLLPTVGECAIGLVMRALGNPALPPEAVQAWKRVQSSGNRARLCTFFLLKYRGLRVLVTCDA